MSLEPQLGSESNYPLPSFPWILHSQACSDLCCLMMLHTWGWHWGLEFWTLAIADVFIRIWKQIYPSLFQNDFNWSVISNAAMFQNNQWYLTVPGRHVHSICSYLVPIRAAFSTALATYQNLWALSVQMSCLDGLTSAYNRFLSLMDKAENHVGVGRQRSLPVCSLILGLLINMGPLKIRCYRAAL